jgi:hypothetical protein
MKILNFILVFLLHIACIGLAVSLYYYRDKDGIPEHELLNILRWNPDIKMSKVTYNKTFLDTAVITVFFAILYGLLLTGHPCRKHVDPSDYKYVTLKNILRLLVTLIIPGIVFFIGLFLLDNIFLEYFA